MTAPLIDLFWSCSQAVTKQRLKFLSEMSALLRNYDIFLGIDAARFTDTRLYAALALHIQERVGVLMGEVAAGTMNLSTFAENVHHMVSCLADGELIHTNNDIPPVRVVNASQLKLLLGEPNSEAPDHIEDFSLDSDVFTLIQECGFSGDLKCGTGLIVISAHISNNEAVKNHSDDYHLFTIFTDNVLDSPIKTAEAIIHENAHNLLNLFLEAQQIVLATDHLSYYSPWTNSLRHDRGIVHGFFAFSTVLNFYGQLSLLNPHEAIKRYASIQLDKLTSVENDLQQILSVYPSSLTDLLMQNYAAARTNF